MHRDLKTELLRAEENHFNKSIGDKRRLQIDDSKYKEEDHHDEPKRLRLHSRLEDTKFKEEEEALEAKEKAIGNSDGDPPSDEEEDSESDVESSSDSESDSEDSEDELQRELEKIKKERVEQKLRQEQKDKERELEEREKEIAYGNPLLNPATSNGDGASGRRKWNDDVIFKNQAKGENDKADQGFINDMIRSDFHRKFMNKYIR